MATTALAIAVLMIPAAFVFGWLTASILLEKGQEK